MNVLSLAALPDVQNEPDSRGTVLDEVGIEGLSYPIALLVPTGDTVSTIARLEMTVELPHDQRGTHMSRFVEAIHEWGRPLAPDGALRLAEDVRERLDAPAARVTLDAPVFVEREAPATGSSSLLRLDCQLRGTSSADRRQVEVGARVPVTSLCPCSKEIAEYGAHSQRGYVDINIVDAAWVAGSTGVWPHDLLAVADAAASAPVIPLLKRADERHVTMAAYDKPAFVEDLARDVAAALKSDERIAAFTVAVTNGESIHDHQAVARLRWSRV